MEDAESKVEECKVALPKSTGSQQKGWGGEYSHFLSIPVGYEDNIRS